MQTEKGKAAHRAMKDARLWAENYVIIQREKKTKHGDAVMWHEVEQMLAEQLKAFDVLYLEIKELDDWAERLRAGNMELNEKVSEIIHERSEPTPPPAPTPPVDVQIAMAAINAMKDVMIHGLGVMRIQHVPRHELSGGLEPEKTA